MTSIVRPLLRIAKLQGRAVLESLVTGQFTLVQGSGKVMTQATATNKSFSFTLDSSLSVSAIINDADTALAWFDSHSTAELNSFLTRRASSVAIARYC